MALHGGGTQTGAQLKNFLLAELTNLIPDGVFDGIEGCGTEDLDTIIEVAVCGDNGAEQVFHKCGKKGKQHDNYLHFLRSAAAGAVR